MSWFSRSFSMKEEDEEERRRRREDDGENEEDGEEEESDSLNLAEIASATGASVKEDLSNLGRTFTRQLWGVASFLAPPPPDKFSVPAERPEVLTGESSHEQGHDAVVRSSSGAKASDIEFHGGNEGISALQSLGLADSSLSNTSAGGLSSAGGTLSASEESDPQETVSLSHDISSSGEKMALSQFDNRGLERPKLTGLQSDFAELRGTVATGFSRITSVLREVTRDDDSGEEDDEEEEHLPLVSSRESPHRSFSSPKDSEQGVNSPRRGFDAFLKPLFGKMLIQEGEEEEENSPSVSSREGPHRPISSPKGSEQGVNSPRRGFDTFLKPLFGNLLMQERSPSGEDDAMETGTDDAKESPDKGEQKYRELESLPSALIASGIGGISKFASSLLKIVGDGVDEDQEDDLEDQYLSEAGLTESVVTFARNIAVHPETWLEFPLTEDEADDEFELTNAQRQHVRALAVAAPSLEALKIELCPNYLTEGRFWKIYFVLMHSRLSLNEALMLYDPQVVEARESMLQELKRRELQTEELDPHQESLTGVHDRDAIRATQPDSKEGEENFGSVNSRPPMVTSAVSNAAGSSSFENVKKTEEVSGVDQSMSGSGEGTDPIESGPDNGRSSMLHLDDDTEVDEWPDEEPSTNQHEIGDPHSHLDKSNLDKSNLDEEDVSFSDLEEDDSPDKAVSSSTPKSPGNVVLYNATAAPLVAKETSSPMTQGEGTPRKSSEKGEFNDWFKVDQDDVASAGSSSP